MPWPGVCARLLDESAQHPMTHCNQSFRSQQSLVPQVTWPRRLSSVLVMELPGNVPCHFWSGDFVSVLTVRLPQCTLPSWLKPFTQDFVCVVLSLIQFARSVLFSAITATLLDTQKT